MNKFGRRLIRIPVAVVILIAVGALTFGSCASVYPPAISTPDVEELAGQLKRSVVALAGEIGERNLYHPAALERAAVWIESEFTAAGYSTRREPVVVAEGSTFGASGTSFNIIAELPGKFPSAGLYVVGAHYDSKVATPGWHDHGPAQPDRPGTPGANDNASGVAALLATARLLARTESHMTIRFVAFTNEEPPFFQDRSAMGSWVHAIGCRERAERVHGMIALETLGLYSEVLHKKRDRLLFLPVSLGFRLELIMSHS